MDSSREQSVIGRALDQLTTGEFRRLVGACGLELREADIEQLQRRRLIDGWRKDGDETYFTPLHLWVVAEYLRAVRPTRHPWATRAVDVTVQEVAALCGDLNAVLRQLEHGDAVSEDKLHRVVEGLGRSIGRVDPFGPLDEIFELLKAEVRSKIKNSGRLYLELRQALLALQEAVELAARRRDGAHGNVDEQGPKTRPMFGAGVPDPPPGARRRGPTTKRIEQPKSPARDAIDEVVSAAEESDQGPQRGEDGSVEGSDVLEVDPDVDKEFEEAAQSFAAENEGLDEESEPIVLLDDELEEFDDFEELEEESSPEASPFERASVATARTRALNDRLEKLRKKDRDRQEESQPTKEGVKPPPSPSERIGELNRRREIYLKEKAWDKLATLYEEGIELFGDLEERRQIYLVLATLYEVKLRRPQEAFDAFGRAWSLPEQGEGRQKAWEGIQRLGRSAGLGERYLEWLEERLGTELGDGDRLRCARELALARFSEGEHEEALQIFWEAISTVEDEAIDAEMINQLHRLGAHTDEEQWHQRLDTLAGRQLSEEASSAVAEAMTFQE